MKKLYSFIPIIFILLLSAKTNYVYSQVAGDYQTIGSGTWTNNTASPAIWQQFNGTAWVASNSPSYTTTFSIYIRNSYTIISGGNYGNSIKIIIDNGGIFNSAHPATVAGVLVKTGGVLNLLDVFTQTGTFKIEANGTVNVNYNNIIDPATTIWKGTENFVAGSNFVITKKISMNGTPLFQSGDITPTTTSGSSAYFGNLLFNFSSSGLASNWTSVFNTLAADLTYNDLSVSGAVVQGNFTLFSGTSAANVVVGGNLTVNSFSNTNNIKVNNGTGTVSVLVKGNYSQPASSQFILASSDGPTSLTVNGSMSVNGNLTLNDHTNNLASLFTTVNLLGNLSVGAGGLVSNMNTSSNGMKNTTFNFTNTSLQQINYSSATPSSAVPYRVKNGASVQLVSSNLVLDNSSSLTIETGGTFDFNWSGSTPLLITKASPSSGANKFVSNVGSILKITSPDGISQDSVAGNVQVAATYDQAGIFWYVGKTDQVTGNGLTSNKTGKLVYVNLLNNATALTLINDIGISGEVDNDPLGGKLEIQKGIVLGSLGKDFSGPGRLVMSDGEYRINTSATAPLTDKVPQLSNYDNYSLSGGTVHLNSVGGFQTLAGKPTYFNLAFSGSNTYGTDYKGVNGTTSVINNVTISSSAIVDVKNFSLKGTLPGTSLTMSGTSRFIMGGTGPKPDFRGTYSLAAGTAIEFSNSTATAEEIKLNPIYSNIDISGSNVANASTTNAPVKMQAGSTFRVKAGGSFSLLNVNGFTGAINTAINNSTNPAVDLEAGSTIEYNSAATAQTVTPRTDYSNLTLSSSAPKIMTGFPAISGNFTVSGGAVSVPSTILFSGTSGTQNIAGLDYKSITFSNGSTKQFTSDASVSYNGILSLTGGTLDLNGKKVTLKAGTMSNYPATAIVGPVSGSITYGAGGQFVVERYIPAVRAFRFLAPSVSSTGSIKDNWMEGQNNPTTATNNNSIPNYGTHISGKTGAAGGFDVTQTNNPSLFVHNNATQVWTDVTNTNGTLVAGYPYRMLVRGDRSINLNTDAPTATNTTLRSSGVLQTGTVVYTNATSPIALNGTNGAFSYIGNPYAAPVDWNSLTTSELSQTYYTWDPTINTRGAYVLYNGFLNITDPSTSAVNPFIQPGQAFFVQATGSNPAVAFNEVNKAINLTPVFRGAGTFPKLSLLLSYMDTTGQRITADGITALFDASFSTNIGEEDSYKFINLDENVAINHLDTSLSVEGRPEIVAADTISLKIWKYRQKDYVLKMDATNFPAGTTAFLKDAYLKTETKINIDDSTLIPFSITTDSASFEANRFKILFSPGSVLPVSLTNVKAYQKEKGIQVEWIARTEINISRYEIEKSLNGLDFEKVALVNAKSNQATANNYAWFDAAPAEGNNFYRIKVIERSGGITYTTIVMVSISKATGSIAVYPNPVKGNTIKLHLTNMPKGSYTITLYNNLGQKVLERQMEHSGGSTTCDITTGRTMPKGTYRLVASREKKDLTATVVFE